MRWLAAGLLGVVGAYMCFDGVRALVVGDYLTASTGEYAGQLGPWSTLVEQVGIPPRSTGMKSAFVAFGLLHLSAASGLAARPDTPATRRYAVVVAGTGLWYLPFGTLLDASVLLIEATSWRRPASGRLPR